jgi:prolyl-tRNA synthetase
VDFVELKTKTPAAATKPAAGAAPAKSAAAASGSKASAKIEDAELIGITVRKGGDFPEWYQQVLRKGDMLDYYDVSGCYILKPWSYSVWEAITSEYSMRQKSELSAGSSLTPSSIDL